MEEKREKWTCLVCTHECTCTACKNIHNEDIDLLKKAIRDCEDDHPDGSILDVDESIFKNEQVGQVTEKYGVEIQVIGRKKAYIIDKHHLNLEYISNHEFANITRLRNLYLMPKRQTKPDEKLKIEKPDKKATEKIGTYPESLNYGPYMQNGYNGMMPINIMPYTNISINPSYGMSIYPFSQCRPEQRMGQMQPYYFPQMYNGYPQMMNSALFPIQYHQNDEFSMYAPPHATPPPTSAANSSANPAESK